MYRGKSELAWGPMSVLCSMIANYIRDPKKTKQFIPSDFSPWGKRRSMAKHKYPLRKDTIQMLKIFVS